MIQCRKKILATFLDKKDEAAVNTLIRENAISCLNSNNFGQEFKNIGGIRPSDNIIKLLDKINEDILDKSNSFEVILQRNFIKYFHNRIGTPLRQLEMPYVRKMDITPFRKGQLVVWEKSYDNYEIVIFLDNTDEYKYKCGTKENDSYILREVSKDLIYHYSDYETIKQDIKPGEPYMGLDYIIETYIM